MKNKNLLTVAVGVAFSAAVLYFTVRLASKAWKAGQQ